MNVGSIVHGAYGDYYEQLVCLKALKRARPGTRLVVFFATEPRREAFRVFDLSFIDEIHPASALATVPVDRFHQYQVRDADLRADILDHLPAGLLAQVDPTRHRKPWTELRQLDLDDPGTAIGLGPEGRDLLPGCIRANGLDGVDFARRPTVGFLWRFRGPSGAVSSRFQPPEGRVRAEVRDLLAGLIAARDCHVIVSGMNLAVTDENRQRIDAKYTEVGLDLPPDRCTYLKGLGWGLELEIFLRCSLRLVMPSGFSEALFLRKPAGTVMIGAPPHYLAKLLWNRMPLFDVLRPRELAFQLARSHDAAAIHRYIRHRCLI